MGKYCHGYMFNATRYYNSELNGKETETAKLLKNIAHNRNIGCYKPSALSILGVKTRLRGISEVKDILNPIIPIPFFPIFEEKGNYLEDIITGRKYEFLKCSNAYAQVYSSELKLRPVDEIPPTEVAETLKSLSNIHINRYVRLMDSLENAIAIGYNRDLEAIREAEIKKQNDISFIKDFRHRNGR